MPYLTEFMAFPVRPGKEARAAEWLEMLVARQAECVATLDREAMHFESIFQVRIAERLHLCWFSAQGNAGAHVSTSSFEVDQLHMQFWRECIDSAAPPLKFEHVVNFVPPAVAEAIAERERALAQSAA
jgi:Family of unknown function (DUF6176)